MAFLDDMRALSSELLASDMLAPATIERGSERSFDPVSGSTTASSETIECRAVLSPSTTINIDGRVQLDTGTISDTTRVTCDTELQNGDRLEVDGLTVTIEEVTAVAPHGGEPLLWKATAR